MDPWFDRSFTMQPMRTSHCLRISKKYALQFWVDIPNLLMSRVYKLYNYISNYKMPVLFSFCVGWDFIRSTVAVLSVSCFSKLAFAPAAWLRLTKQKRWLRWNVLLKVRHQCLSHVCYYRWFLYFFSLMVGNWNKRMVGPQRFEYWYLYYIDIYVHSTWKG